MSNKKLYKSSTDKRICGVCGGIAQYLNVSSKFIRIIFVAILIFNILTTSIFGGLPTVIMYFVFAIIMPKESKVNQTSNETGTLTRNPHIDPKDIID